jgi:hypothetical protein
VNFSKEIHTWNKLWVFGVFSLSLSVSFSQNLVEKTKFWVTKKKSFFIPKIGYPILGKRLVVLQKREQNSLNYPKNLPSNKFLTKKEKICNF